MNSKGRSYTILLIPGHKNGKTISIHCSRSAFITLAGVSGLIVLLAGFTTFASFDTLRKRHVIAELRRENGILIKENNYVRLLTQKIEKLETLANYLQQLAEISPSSQADLIADKTPYLGSDSMQSVENKTGIEDSMPTTLPVRGWVTQKFSSDTTHRGIAHLGIDIAADKGTPIIAAAPGMISDVSEDQFYGNLITIDHGNGFITRYGHCLKIFVTKGQHVYRGQRIALVGNTGYSSAPHLHYEVIKNGKNINPLGFIVAGKAQP
jgi:murein DD-endopeptidase MepM/ murein hydrolase activator NlpD